MNRRARSGCKRSGRALSAFWILSVKQLECNTPDGLRDLAHGHGPVPAASENYWEDHLPTRRYPLTAFSPYRQRQPYPDDQAFILWAAIAAFPPSLCDRRNRAPSRAKPATRRCFPMAMWNGRWGDRRAPCRSSWGRSALALNTEGTPRRRQKGMPAKWSGHYEKLPRRLGRPSNLFGIPNKTPSSGSDQCIGIPGLSSRSSALLRRSAGRDSNTSTPR